jgi:hypothetical protein
MHGCATVKLGAFALDDASSKVGSVRFVTVWRRHMVSAILGITESQLVDLAIVVGCDFTRALLDDRSDLGVLTSEGQVGDYPFQIEASLMGAPAFAGLLDCIQCMSRSQRVGVRPGNDALHLAVKYCRAFYEADLREADYLEGQLLDDAALSDADLVVDPVEVDANSENGDDETVSEGGVRPDCEVADAWDYVSELIQEGHHELPAIAQKIVQFLTVHAAAAAEHSPITEITDVESDSVDSVDFWPDLEHCQCLTKMLTDLSEPEPCMQGMTHTPVPTWTDVLVADVYQQLLLYAVLELYPLPLDVHTAAQVNTPQL